jgi:hypothetical protein
LWDTKCNYLTHFSQTLEGSLTGMALPASMRHARNIADAQASKVMCWADQAVKLEFL